MFRHVRPQWCIQQKKILKWPLAGSRPYNVGSEYSSPSSNLTPSQSVSPCHVKASDPTTRESFTQRSIQVVAATGILSAAFVLPGASQAAETLSEGGLSVLLHFLEYVESLGPAGGILFILTVMVFEMVPLFPTQPLSLAGGLLFGPIQGAFAVLIGVTLAATNAFLISRGFGRQLAQKIIEYEMAEEDGAQGPSPVAAKLAEVQATIESGGPWQQLTAILLLRLTPVVPFSASNYVLGLTPVALLPYVGGTMIGMSVWSVLYASLGAASRQFFDGGEDLGTIFSDLAYKTGAYTSTALSASALLAIFGGIAYFTHKNLTRPGPHTTEHHSDPSKGSELKDSNMPVCSAEEERVLSKVK